MLISERPSITTA